MPTDSLVERLRIVKDKDEIEETRRACSAGERAFEVVKALLTPEMTELDVAAELEYQSPAVRREGAELSGDRRGRAAGRAAARDADVAPSSSRDDFMLIDWGANSGPLHERLDADHSDR